MDLNLRLKNEEVFHDRKFAECNRSPKHYRLNTSMVILKEIINTLGDINDIDVLEYGCGNGWVTSELAALGANVYAFDISKEAVLKTNEFLITNNLHSKVHLNQMPAEKLQYQNNRFPIVVGFAILHHLELKNAIPELYRVIKPGGIGIFAEPLGNNVLIILYRKFTPLYRSKDEQPIKYNEIESYQYKFKKLEHSEYFLSSILPIGLYNIGLFSDLVYKVFTKTEIIDRKILSTHRALSKYSWYTILKFYK